MRITYKIAQEEDLDSIVNFLSKPHIDNSFNTPLSQRPYGIYERVRRKYDEGHWIIAEEPDDRDVVGCVALMRDVNNLEVSTYVVDSNYRRMGIGGQLLEHLVEIYEAKYRPLELILDTHEGSVVENYIGKYGFEYTTSFPDPEKRPDGVKTAVYTYRRK